MADRVIAVAVALLIPDGVRVAASELNAQLSPTLRFDSSHLPHITVLQQFLPEDHLSGAEAALARVVARFGPIPIQVTGLGTQPFDSTHVLYWEIERSQPLKVLHDRVWTALTPLTSSGDAGAFFGGKVRPSTVKYVQDFARNGAGDRFDPHLTVGFGERDLQQAPFAFIANRVAICHLGDLNTCRRVLYEAQL
jgi:2'-5' RNA ligase